jgi:hypothetical protein
MDLLFLGVIVAFLAGVLGPEALDEAGKSP